VANLPGSIKNCTYNRFPVPHHTALARSYHIPAIRGMAAPLPPAGCNSGNWHLAQKQNPFPKF
jgi:hypothetical protein